MKLVEVHADIADAQYALADAVTATLAYDAASDEERNQLVEVHRHAHLVAMTKLVRVRHALEEMIDEERLSSITKRRN